MLPSAVNAVELLTSLTRKFLSLNLHFLKSLNLSKIMCKSPFWIDNPNYHSNIRDPTYHLIHDTIHQKIPVPCGRCSACVHLKQVYLIQRVQMEALNHDLFYGTLTYNPESLPIAQYGKIKFAYPDFSDWQKMIKMIRKDYPEFKFKYILVSEYGGKKHRPHFHFILSFPKVEDSISVKVSQAYKLFNIFLRYWRRNYGSTRTPIWKPLCTYVRKRIRGQDYYNYDLHWLDPNSSKDGLDGVAFYVTKYILKYDEWVDKFKSFLFFNIKESDYKDALDKFRPRILFSKFFGSPFDPDVKFHLDKGINYALGDNTALFPYYISRQNGAIYPLSPYFSKRLLTVEDMIVFCQRRQKLDNEVTPEDVHQFEVQEHRMALSKAFLNSQSLLIDFDDMLDINTQFLQNGNFAKTTQMDSDFADCWQDFDSFSDYSDDDSDDILFD